MKEEIQSCQAALQQVREETDTCRGELAVRNLKMVDQEVEAKLLAMRRSILEEQRNKLLERDQILAADLVCGVYIAQIPTDLELFALHNITTS